MSYSLNGRIYRYGRMLYVLSKSKRAMTTNEVAEAIDGALSATRDTLGRMGVLRLVHRITPPSKVSPATWGLGAPPEGASIPKIKLRPGCPGGGGDALISLAIMVRAMLDGPISVAELAQLTGCTRNTTRMQVAALREAGVIFIAEWSRERSAGAWAPCWKFGVDRKNTPQPQAIPEQALRARYKAGRRMRDKGQFIVNALAANSAAFEQVA